MRALAVVALGAGVLWGMGCDGGGSSAEPPSPPTNLQATTTNGAVSLTWNGGSAVSGYNVYRSTTADSGVGGTPVNGGSPLGQTEFTDASVEAGTRYYYRVTAVGEAGESEPSSEVSIRLFPSPPPRP